jgi:hypothetical protein
MFHKIDSRMLVSQAMDDMVKFVISNVTAETDSLLIFLKLFY